MKRSILKFSVILISMVFIFGCGGGGSSKIDGPTLSLGEALSLIVDQLYINGGLEDEYASRGEFSIYLRDAATGQDVACTRGEDGMEELDVIGVYYGGLSIPLKEVDGDHPKEMARFQIVFVERDSEGCPNPIDDDDDIAGISAEFSFENLLDQQIWAMNGKAAVVLRAPNTEERNVSAMAPSLTEELIIDKLYFNNGSDGQTASRYYIFVDRVEDGESVYQCQVSDDLMDAVRYGGIAYSALGFPIECFSPTDPNFQYIPVRVGLYIQKSSGPTLVGETEAVQIGDIIGETVEFTNGKGYVSFDNVMTTPFSASVIRLSELAMIEVNALEYELTPSYNATIELHATDASGDYIIACAGAEQGLTGVGSPGSYTGLEAQFVAATGQKELFGWDDVLIRLVERTDNLACPAPLTSEPTVLATTGDLTSANLGATTLEFLNGAGHVTLSITSSENN